MSDFLDFLLDLGKTVVPAMVKWGMDAAPTIVEMRKAANNLGTQVAPDNAKFAEFKAMVTALETEFQADVAAHLKLVGEG